MSITWDNPHGLHFFATQACRRCGKEKTSRIWSRPWQMAGQRFADCLPEKPLNILQIGRFLRDAPFSCEACPSTEARVTSVTLDEGVIYF